MQATETRSQQNNVMQQMGPFFDCRGVMRVHSAFLSLVTLAFAI